MPPKQAIRTTEDIVNLHRQVFAGDGSVPNQATPDESASRWRPVADRRPLTAFDAYTVMQRYSPRVAFAVLSTRLHRDPTNPHPSDGRNCKFNNLFGPSPPNDTRGFHLNRWPTSLPPYPPRNPKPAQSPWADNFEHAFEVIYVCSNSRFTVLRRLKGMVPAPDPSSREARLSEGLCSMRFRIRGCARLPARLVGALGPNELFARSTRGLLPWEFDVCSRVVLEVDGEHTPFCQNPPPNCIAPPLAWTRMTPAGELWVARAAYHLPTVPWGRLMQNNDALRVLNPPPWATGMGRHVEHIDPSLMELYRQLHSKVKRLAHGRVRGVGSIMGGGHDKLGDSDGMSEGEDAKLDALDPNAGVVGMGSMQAMGGGMGGPGGPMAVGVMGAMGVPTQQAAAAAAVAAAAAAARAEAEAAAAAAVEGLTSLATAMPGTAAAAAAGEEEEVDDVDHGEPDAKRRCV